MLKRGSLVSVTLGCALGVGACGSDEGGVAGGGTGGTAGTAGAAGATGGSAGLAGSGGSSGTAGTSGSGGSGGRIQTNCGNATLDTGETCDDGNTDAADGCSGSCQVECGYLCLEAGKPCVAGFNGVQCASPGPPFGQPSDVANDCRLVTMSVDGTFLELSDPTTEAGNPRHLDAIFTNGKNELLGFAGDTTDIASGSHLVVVSDTAKGTLTAKGAALGFWVVGAGMSDTEELWVTLYDTYELNENRELRLARIDPKDGTVLAGPTVVTSNGTAIETGSIHVSDVAFRADGKMFISSNEPWGSGGPGSAVPSRYLEVDPQTATVVDTITGPLEPYAAGIVFIGSQSRMLAMDILSVDDIYSLDLSVPSTLDAKLLYADPIPTNSGTADLAGCVKLPDVVPR